MPPSAFKTTFPQKATHGVTVQGGVLLIGALAC